MSIFRNGLLFCVLVAVSLQRVTASPEVTESATRYVSKINRKMFPLYEDLHSLTFNKKKDELNETAISKTIDEIAELTREANRLPLNEIDDAELKTAVQNIARSSYLYILGAEDFRNMADTIDLIVFPAYRKTICLYKNLAICDLAYIPDVRNMLASNSYDADTLLYYWSEYRADVEENSRPFFKSFKNLFIMAANKTGVSPVEFLYNYYGGDVTISDNMQKVMEDLMPFYRKFHAYVRNELNKNYGDQKVSLSAPIPDHIFEIVPLQAWKKNSMLQQTFPGKRLPNLKAGLEREFNSVSSMIDNTEQFFTSLGLDSLPRKMRNSFRTKPGRIHGSSECKADIYDETPKVRMEYCPQINIKKFLQMHGYLGRVHYAYEKRDLPFHYFNSYKFETAVGEAAILSASSPNHLEKLGIVEDFTYTWELQMNRLFRMGVHTMFTLPTYFVHAKLFEDILSEVVPKNNENVQYWKLMETYAGVEPPKNRNLKAFDMSYKFFEDLKKNIVVTKFVSEIVGYQIYEQLCTQSGQYGPKVPRKQLHECNLEGSKVVGQYLKPMMQMGSKEPWRKVLSQVTMNENGLSAKSILNYYAPLEKWLDEQIAEQKIHVGWTEGTKAVNLRTLHP